jgi:hypothetical protein
LWKGTLDDIALAQVVRIDASTREVEVLLQVDRGLFLKGRVVHPSGAAAAECMVHANLEGAWAFGYDNTDAEGRFSIGPLPRGRFSVLARQVTGPSAPSETIYADAGTTDLVLHLREGCSISGRVVDAAGRPRACELTVGRAGDERGLMMTATADGSFHFEGQPAGTLAIGARTSDGLCAVRSGIVLKAGAPLDGVEVVLQAGATLNLRYEGEERWSNFAVLVDGFQFAGDGSSVALRNAALFQPAH